jgi:chromosome segregation ATPase
VAAERVAAAVATRRAERARRANAAEGRVAQADTRIQAAEAEVAAAEARSGEAQRSNEQTIQDLNRRLSEAAAHEAERDAALQALTSEAHSLRENVSEHEQALTSSQEHIQTLRSANQTQNQEIAGMTNELAAATAESESLRQQLTTALQGASELHQHIATLETDLATAKGESEAARTSALELQRDREVAEGRIARAYQKIRDDEKIKGKAKKAIEIALALLQEAGYSPEQEAPAAEPGESVDEARS